MTPARIVIGSARRSAHPTMYPRTLQECFGPYARLTVEDRRRADHWDRMIGVLCAVIGAGIVAVLVVERLG